MRGECPLHIVADKTLLQPLVPIEADCSGCVEVIQQDVLFRQRMMVGSDVSPVHEECGIAITLAHIAEDLVVGAILFHQKKYMLYAQCAQILDSASRPKMRII